MRWPWQHEPTPGGEEALEDASRQLDRVNAQWPEVRELAEGLRKQRRENHFKEKVAALFQGRAV